MMQADTFFKVGTDGAGNVVVTDGDDRTLHVIPCNYLGEPVSAAALATQLKARLAELVDDMDWDL